MVLKGLCTDVINRRRIWKISLLSAIFARKSFFLNLTAMEVNKKTGKKTLFYLTLNDLNEFLQAARRQQQNKTVNKVFHSKKKLTNICNRVTADVMY